MMSSKLKWSLLALVFCAIGVSASAQKRYRSPLPNNPYYDMKPLHLGFLLGANTMGFHIKTKDDFKSNDTLYGLACQSRPGFSVGMVINLNLGEYFDIRCLPTLSFGERRLEYSIHEGGLRVRQEYKSIESTYAEAPIEIKWKSLRAKNFRAYCVGGVKYSYDFASNARKKETNEEDVLIKISPHDLSFTTGVGFDFYLPYKNKFSLEIKMSFGMLDLLTRENNLYTNGVEYMHSKNLQIAITFE